MRSQFKLAFSRPSAKKTPILAKKYRFVVQKFGGESVDETQKVWEMLEQQESGQKLAVVSAFSKVTDQLFGVLKKKRGEKLELADFDEVVQRSLVSLTAADARCSTLVRTEIIDIVGDVVKEANTLPGEADAIKEDIVIGLGERISARVVASHSNLLSKQGKYVAVDLAELIGANIVLDERAPDWLASLFSLIENRLLEVLQPILAAGKTPILTGYIGRLPGGTMKLMDRGYSDSTLMLVSRALIQMLIGEQRIRADICKTVKGVLSADPKAFNVKTTRKRKGQKLTKKDQPQLRPFLTKRIVARLAATGMKAVNAVAADILEKSPKVDAVVRHTFHPNSDEQTYIVDKLPNTVSSGFKVIAHKVQSKLLVRNTSKLNQSGWIAQILELVAKERLSVNVVESPDNSCTILTDKDTDKIDRIKRNLEGLGNIADVSNVGWITCAEDGWRPVGQSNLDLGHAINELYLHGINVLRVTANPGGEISLMVSEKDMVHAVRYLHQTIISSN